MATVYKRPQPSSPLPDDVATELEDYPPMNSSRIRLRDGRYDEASMLSCTFLVVCLRLVNQNSSIAGTSRTRREGSRG